MDYIRISQQSTDNGQQTLSANEVKELLKDWIKLYPNSFASDVEFRIYHLTDGDIIIQLHEDMSSLAVALLVLYLGSTDNRQQSSSVSVCFLLEDNYVLDYDFERRPQPVKDSELQFEETDFALPEVYESVVVGDVVKKEIDKVLEDEGLTPKKLMWYFICGVVGLAIGFLIVYLTGK